MRYILFFSLVLSCVTPATAQQPQGPGDSTSAGAASNVRLTDEEQRELQSVLNERLLREREYKEAALVAQMAQARYEAVNNAAIAQFYRLCAKHKLDPDKYELTPDGTGIRPKPAPPIKKPVNP